MANTVNVAIIETANTFNHWRIRDNLTANDVNEIARGNFVKPTGNVTINEGFLRLANTSGGTILDVKDDARIDGTLSLRNIDQDGAGFVYLASGDIALGNRAAAGLLQVNVNTKIDSANVEFSNGNVFFSNSSATGLVVIRPNTNFLNNVTVSGTMNVTQNAHFTGNTTNVTGNLIVTGQTVNISNLLNVTTANIITANLATLNVFAVGAVANIRTGNVTNAAIANAVVIELNATTANITTVNATTFITTDGLNVTDQANTARTQANNARDQANTARDQANTARDQANTARGQANAAYADSNTRVLKAGDTMTGILTVSANIVSQNIVPSTNLTFNIGSSALRYKDIWLSNSTIYMGDAYISANGNRIDTAGLNVVNGINATTMNATTMNTTTIVATTLQVTNPIVAPAETSEGSYRLRVGTTTRDDGFFGVYLGSTSNGNAFIRFDSTAAVWRAAANSTEGTYRTLLTTQNVVDSVVSTSTTDAGSPNAIKTSYDQAVAARNQANTARDVSNGSYGKANGAYGKANGAYTQANGAYAHSNVVYAQANTARDQANTARTTANGAYGTANTAATNALNAYGQANTARDQANTARDQANTARDQANTARTQANTAYGQANTATTNASTADTIAKNAYGQANTATTVGQNAYGQANTATTTAQNAYGAANSKVATVSGTAGRITSSGTTGITLDLATAGTGAASYTSGVSAITVDAYGRVTSVTGSANYITTSGRAFPKRSDGTNVDFIYSGQSGQPTYLWGTNDGTNFYVWNPSNFSVSYASTAGNADTVDGYHAASFALLSGATFSGSVYAPAYFYTSDRRFKENVRTIDDAITKVMGLRGVYFNMKDDPDKRDQLGVIAQEVRQFVPEAVVDNEQNGMSVAYGNMIGLLIEAIKEQQRQIDALKAEVNTLKAQ